MGLILLVSGLGGFQLTYSSAYAQVLENGTAASNIFQNQLLPDQNSTPGPSPNDSPSQQDSVIGGDGSAPTPNAATPSENTADDQSLGTGETIGNSIVQNPVPGSEGFENSQPTGEQVNQPRADDNDDDDPDPGWHATGLLRFDRCCDWLGARFRSPCARR